MKAARPQTGLTALVPAAGLGERYGGPGPKQFLELAGRPLLAWTLDRLRAAGVENLIVAVPPGLVGEAERVLGSASWLRFVAGGTTRQASVEACLQAERGAPEDLLLVHDGARPLVSPEDIQATVRAASTADGAVLGRPVRDTLKRVEEGLIFGTEDRTGRFRAETPQVFRRRVLEDAFDLAGQQGFLGTDESSLVERLPNSRIVAVTATRPNPKLTDGADAEVVETLLGLAAGRETAVRS